MFGACATPEQEDVQAAEAWYPVVLDDAENWYPPALDLDTLQAETPYGTLQGEAWEKAYVGAVTDDRFVGISLSEGTHTEAAQEVRIYFCDSDGTSVRLFGEVDAEKKTIEVGDESVELSFSDDVVRGTVILNGEEPQTFEATEASDDAGVYSAEATMEDDDWWFGWIVLPDGRQLGGGQGSNCFRDPRTGERICRYLN